jgi:hypothetical protein
MKYFSYADDLERFINREICYKEIKGEIKGFGIVMQSIMTALDDVVFSRRR